MTALLTEHLATWIAADTTEKSARGRSKAASLYGVKKLRELILELAVRGLLVSQDHDDEPASELLKNISAEKAQLVKEGKIKAQKPLPPIGDDEKPFELPKGWEWVRLDDVGTTNIGLTYSPKDISDNGVPVLRSSNVQQGRIDLSDLVRVDTSVKDSLFVENGDLLICARNGSKSLVGKTAMIRNLNEKMTFGAFMAIYRSQFNSYIEVFLNSPIFRNLLENVSTTTINQITQANLKSTLVTLPPLAEQQRIVTKVDELMALCDQLEQQQNNSQTAHQHLVSQLLNALTQADNANHFQHTWQRIASHFDVLFTTEDSINQLKQSILQLAVMGKLVPQNCDDEPASELLKKIAAEKAKLVKEGKIKAQKPLSPIGDDEKPFELPKGWEWARFPELGEFGRGKSKHRPRNDPKLFNPPIYPLVQTGEVARAKNIIEEYHSKYSEFGLAQSKLWSSGTLCITIAANIADSALLGFDACFPDSVVGFAPHKPLNDARYLLTFMKTARENLLKFAPATAQKNINLEILESVLIPVPPLAEISRIVSKVDELMALCDQLKNQLNQAKHLQGKIADVLVEQALA